MPAALSIPMPAGIDNFWIIVAIIVISSIWEWIRKKTQQGETGTWPGESESQSPSSPPRRTTTAPTTAAPRPVATSDWEEELRRLLGGEPPAAQPPPIAPPPIRPVIIQEPKPPQPHRPLTAAPPVARTVPPPLAEPRIAAADKAVDVQLPTLRESMAAYRRASHLRDEVAEHLQRVEEMTERHLSRVPTVRRRAYSAEAARTISLIRQRATVRQAVIAAQIFGPPKALGDE